MSNWYVFLAEDGLIFHTSAKDRGGHIISAAKEKRCRIFLFILVFVFVFFNVPKS